MLAIYILITIIFAISLWVIGVRIFNEKNDNQNRREITSENGQEKIMSLKETLTEEIYIEALSINYRQERVNERVAKGELTDSVQNEQLKIEHDRKRLVDRGIKVGLIDNKINNTM